MRWGTPALQQHLAAGPLPRATPQWSEWAAHRAHITAHTVPYIGEPPPIPDTQHQYVALQIARTAIGDDGWHQNLPEITVYCTASAAPDRWLVDQLQLTEAAGQP
ncbi:hypothetical protein REH65_33070 (plasmid) [Saccharopolyspora sp. ID03-671]|uniref:hypothetical protein n=1 Tax=Saccharopolyspora sp. ID03-671 TaxID=3073066 RepID=UPI0030F43688